MAALLNTHAGEFAVEAASAMNVYVNRCAITSSDDMQLADLLPLGSASTAVLGLDNQMAVTSQDDVVIDGGLYDLVMESEAPDSTQDATPYIISNDGGQTAPSYILTPKCNLSEPTDITATDLDFHAHHHDSSWICDRAFWFDLL